MILYLLVVLFLMLAVYWLAFKFDAGIFFVQIFFWFFGFFGILSVLYLELVETYIIEQFRYSYFNGAALVLVFLFISHLCGGAVGIWLLKRRLYGLRCIKEAQAIRHNRWNGIYLYSSLFVLFLLYFNVFLSGVPPLLNDGYIDRFSYIESTYLWWLVGVFGAVAVPLPILLGWLLHVSGKKIVIGFMAILYFFYLALIGQKFGGFMLGCFLIFLPTACAKMVGSNIYRWLPRILACSIIIGGGALGIVYYHYSNYSLAENFGGPLGLIAYRIFGLQGHAYWGGFNYFLDAPFGYFNFVGLMDGMQNVMRLISPSIADEMIERGVSFTFGYFVSLLLHLGVFAFPFSLFMGMLYVFLSYLVVSSAVKKRFLGYFVFANLIVVFNGVVSMGSFSYVFSSKILLLLIILALVSFFRAFWRASVKDLHHRKAAISNGI